MTAERIVEGVKESLGIISDDTDINNQIRGKAIAVMHYINNGGGNITKMPPNMKFRLLLSE